MLQNLVTVADSTGHIIEEFNIDHHNLGFARLLYKLYCYEKDFDTVLELGHYSRLEFGSLGRGYPKPRNFFPALRVDGQCHVNRAIAYLRILPVLNYYAVKKDQRVNRIKGSVLLLLLHPHTPCL